MVGWFGAVQAQEYAQTKWSLGLRLPHLKDDDIEKDFKEGRILRTHLLRPTWHFVSPEDIRWMLNLTAPRVNAANAFMYKKLELDNKSFNRYNKILIKSLRDKKELTRDELNEEFKKKKIIADGFRLSYIMMRAELDGILCSGARRGNQFTYALLEERVPSGKVKPHDEALAELAKRYFTSRGPSTVKDFSTWSGLTLTDCRKAHAMIKTQFIEERMDHEYYYYAEHLPFTKNQFHQFYLLPVYDEFIMGYKDRTAILKIRNSLDPKPLFRFDNTIIFDGQITGTWRRTINKKSMDFEYEFFKPPVKKQMKTFMNAVHRLGEFANLMVNIKK
ncbi:MAG: Winged helix DNA-binding protein [Chitinophagaceae bacterium]|nr:Winged helix DNA-binding protein [Chitinophagaceae bacterium]